MVAEAPTLASDTPIDGTDDHLVLPSDQAIRSCDGVWWVAAIHWILAVAAIMFLVGHLYLGSTGDKVRDLYAAMLDGNHRHRTREP